MNLFNINNKYNSNNNKVATIINNLRQYKDKEFKVIRVSKEKDQL